MFKEFSEERFMRKAPEAQADVMPEAPEETRTYQRYQALGGKINEIDYKRVLTDATAPSAASMGQAEYIAKASGITLHNEAGAIDERVALYGILRDDRKPENVEHHHERMSDQQLFAEALRMVGDVDSLDKLKKAHTNINF